MALSFSDLQPDKPRLALVASLIAALTIPAIGYLLWSAMYHDVHGESLAFSLIAASFFISGGLGLFVNPRGQEREGISIMRSVAISMIMWGFVWLSYDLPSKLEPTVFVPLVIIATGAQFLIPVLAAFIVIRQRRNSRNQKSARST